MTSNYEQDFVFDNESLKKSYYLMLDYYPEVIKSIKDFRCLVLTQCKQLLNITDNLNTILDNCFVQTSDETTINKWEALLQISTPPQGDTELDDWLFTRRSTILSRLYRADKLNSEHIGNVVNIWTGGGICDSYFKDGVIHVEIIPPPSNRQFGFSLIRQELEKKIPAHLSLVINESFYMWSQIKNLNQDWATVKNTHTDWEDVYSFVDN